MEDNDDEDEEDVEDEEDEEQEDKGEVEAVVECTDGARTSVMSNEQSLLASDNK